MMRVQQYRPTLRNTFWSLLTIATRRFPDSTLEAQAKLLETCLRTPELRSSLSQSVRNVRVDQKHLKHYCRIVGAPYTSVLPPLYPQVLMGPSQLALLSNPDYPVKMLGAIHKKNAMTQTGTVTADDRFDLELGVLAVRHQEHGLEVDFEQTLTKDRRVMWRSVSTFLVRRATNTTSTAKANTALRSDDPRPSLEHTDPSLSWRLPNEIGRYYAHLTGDYNPIHVSHYLARRQRFHRAIAHGLCVVAMGIERWQKSAGCGINLVKGDQGWTLDIDFKGPNYLGSHMALFSKEQSGAHRMSWYCGQNDRPTILAKLKPYVG